jgi:hypothetical protein
VANFVASDGQRLSVVKSQSDATGPIGPTDGWVYHYASAPTALEHILQDMRIRLGPVHDANDPWEARGHRTWLGITRTPLEVCCPSVLPLAFDELEHALGRARVACFSQDDLDDPDPQRAAFVARSTRGWAQDRMWAQYADGHRGVCLAFDRDALLEAFDSELVSHGQRFARAVVCGDEQYESGSIKPDEAEAEVLGPVRHALAFRDRTAQHRFFTKRRDWHGEREWRLVLFDDNPTGSHAFVSIDRALRAIIVGHRFADAYQPVVAAACRRLGFDHYYRLAYSGVVRLSRRELAPAT